MAGEGIGEPQSRRGRRGLRRAPIGLLASAPGSALSAALRFFTASILEPANGRHPDATLGATVLAGHCSVPSVRSVPSVSFSSPFPLAHMTRPLPTIAARVLCCCGFSFARSLGKVERMLTDPLCSAPLLAGVIGTDPLLTARILGRANAAAPADAGAILHLSAAIQHLGLATVHGLVLETRAIPAAQARTMAACWALANATASMCRILRSFCRASVREGLDGEVLYCCGLLHDLGTVLAHRLWPEDCAAAATLLERRGGTPADALHASLGLEAGHLGLLLASAWSLPPLLGLCMRHHAAPAAAPSDQEIIAVVHVARCLVRACGFTVPGDPYVAAIATEAMDCLGLRITDLEGAIRLFFDELDEHEVYEGVLAPG
jgi:HD-like signal output (HDOD) protein